MVMQSFLIGGGENLRRSEPAISASKASDAEAEPHIAEIAHSVLSGDVTLVDVSHLSGAEMLQWVLSRR